MEHAHTYTSPRLESALARVKRELGKDAIIVSSRRVDARGFEVRAVAAEHAGGWTEPGGTPPSAPPPLLERLLVQSGLEPGLSQLLAGSAPGRARTLGECTRALAASLESHIAFERPSFEPNEHGPRAIAWVGPPGVGKTTTLAKIAAEAALIERRAVGLITLDAYRVGAVAQIEQLADLMGVPLEVAEDASSFRRAMRRLADAEVVFIDTAGRARRDEAAIGQLAETLHSTENNVDVTLLLGATARPLEIADAVERHQVLMPKWLTMTKLDEALSHDAVVTAHVASGLPLAWFTTGQRVPEDVEVASAERLAAALCGEEVYG
ncbi:MAG: AAA family ATPase [Sandaracinaceae bacterium]